MRILVMGAGALGSVFGGFLRLAGHEVALVGRKPHLEAIRKEGLQITGLWGDHQARGFIAAEEVSQLPAVFYDLVLLPVKSHDTLATAALSAPLLAPGGLAVSLQNGLGNAEILVSQVGPDRAAAARVIFGAELTAPGKVKVTVCADPVVVGKAAPGTNPALDQKIRQAAAVLREAGIDTEWVADVHSYLWAKSIFNSALNPLGALLGVTYGKLAENDYTREIMNRIISEVFAVARAKAVKLAWDSPEAYGLEFYGRLVPSTAGHRPSMLQDMEAGRRTEIDALNGRIAEYGRDLGIPTPVNELIASLIRAKEQLNHPGIPDSASSGRSVSPAPAEFPAGR